VLIGYRRTAFRTYEMLPNAGPMLWFYCSCALGIMKVIRSTYE
jgi:hypothetical protein